MTTKLAAPTGAAFFTTQIGLWLHLTSRAIDHLHAIQDDGFDYVLVKIADGASAYHPDDARRLVKDAGAIKLGVAAWCYVYPRNIVATIQAIVASIPPGVTELVVDAEKEWEEYCAANGAEAAKKLADQLMSGIAAATGHRVNLHLSSFWSPSIHSQIPYKAFASHCATWQPQAYYAPGSKRTPASILAGSLSEGAVLSVSCMGRACVATINDTAFLPTLKARGIKGFSVYVWDPEGDAAVSINPQKWKAAIAAFRAS
ncbi:MAG: hypothetical protein ABIY70_09060 [Capsulimonas sp.]|uniref:hypothetical protein n=1 Tax=Capsulimonas sp. TaxID=2494211 RepID=UPI003263395D